MEPDPRATAEREDKRTEPEILLPDFRAEASFSVFDSHAGRLGRRRWQVTVLQPQETNAEEVHSDFPPCLFSLGVVFGSNSQQDRQQHSCAAQAAEQLPVLLSSASSSENDDTCGVVIGAASDGGQLGCDNISLGIRSDLLVVRNGKLTSQWHNLVPPILRSAAQSHAATLKKIKKYSSSSSSSSSSIPPKQQQLMSACPMSPFPPTFALRGGDTVTFEVDPADGTLSVWNNDIFYGVAVCDLRLRLDGRHAEHQQVQPAVSVAWGCHMAPEATTPAHFLLPSLSVRSASRAHKQSGKGHTDSATEKHAFVGKTTLHTRHPFLRQPPTPYFSNSSRGDRSGRSGYRDDGRVSAALPFVFRLAQCGAALDYKVGGAGAASDNAAWRAVILAVDGTSPSSNVAPPDLGALLLDAIAQHDRDCTVFNFEVSARETSTPRPIMPPGQLLWVDPTRMLSSSIDSSVLSSPSSSSQLFFASCKASAFASWSSAAIFSSMDRLALRSQIVSLCQALTTADSRASLLRLLGTWPYLSVPCSAAESTAEAAEAHHFPASVLSPPTLSELGGLRCLRRLLLLVAPRPTANEIFRFSVEGTTDHSSLSKHTDSEDFNSLNSLRPLLMWILSGEATATAGSKGKEGQDASVTQFLVAECAAHILHAASSSTSGNSGILPAVLSSDRDMLSRPSLALASFLLGLLLDTGVLRLRDISVLVRSLHVFVHKTDGVDRVEGTRLLLTVVTHANTTYLSNNASVSVWLGEHAFSRRMQAWTDALWTRAHRCTKLLPRLIELALACHGLSPASFSVTFPSMVSTPWFKYATALDSTLEGFLSGEKTAVEAIHTDNDGQCIMFSEEADAQLVSLVNKYAKNRVCLTPAPPMPALSPTHAAAATDRVGVGEIGAEETSEVETQQQEEQRQGQHEHHEVGRQTQEAPETYFASLAAFAGDAQASYTKGDEGAKSKRILAHEIPVAEFPLTSSSVREDYPALWKFPEAALRARVKRLHALNVHVTRNLTVVLALTAAREVCRNNAAAKAPLPTLGQKLRRMRALLYADTKMPIWAKALRSSNVSATSYPPWHVGGSAIGDERSEEDSNESDRHCWDRHREGRAAAYPLFADSSASGSGDGGVASLFRTRNSTLRVSRQFVRPSITIDRLSSMTSTSASITAPYEDDTARRRQSSSGSVVTVAATATTTTTATSTAGSSQRHSQIERLRSVVEGSRPQPRIEPSEQSQLMRGTVFGQTWRALRAVDPRSLRQIDRAWHVRFSGEAAVDAGGPYRETLSQIVAELTGYAMGTIGSLAPVEEAAEPADAVATQGKLPVSDSLFVPTPNGRRQVSTMIFVLETDACARALRFCATHLTL